jgi:hypothetical protein
MQVTFAGIDNLPDCVAMCATNYRMTNITGDFSCALQASQVLSALSAVPLWLALEMPVFETSFKYNVMYRFWSVLRFETSFKYYVMYRFWLVLRFSFFVFCFSFLWFGCIS